MCFAGLCRATHSQSLWRTISFGCIKTRRRAHIEKRSASSSAMSFRLGAIERSGASGAATSIASLMHRCPRRRRARNRILARVRALFNWAVERGRIAASPVAGMKPPTKERPRDRVLSDDELRWLWLACEVIDWPFGPLVKLLLLTAQRRDEVAGWNGPRLTSSAAWTMPGEKSKNDRAHELQLSEAAIEF